MSLAPKMINWGAVFKYARLNRFNKILADTKCIELNFFGQQFSWRKKRGGLIIFSKELIKP